MLQEKSLLGRSACPACHHTLAWYDLIPVISWIMLHGQCRYCQTPISPLYPFIELLTGVSCMLLVLWQEPIYFPVYFIFFSALIVTVRTDLESMLISRYTTIFLIPLGIGASVLSLLPISLLESIVGAIAGYGILWLIAWAYKKRTGTQGMGEGDLDLLAFIGAFTGLMGIWVSLMAGSVIGSVSALLYLYLTGKPRTTRIPFGPFLAFGAIIFVLLIA